MTKKEVETLKGLYLQACVRKERAADSLVRAREDGEWLTDKAMSHAIATAKQVAIMDVMMAFFDDSTIDAIEEEAWNKYQADPSAFTED